MKAWHAAAAGAVIGAIGLFTLIDSQHVERQLPSQSLPISNSSPLSDSQKVAYLDQALASAKEALRHAEALNAQLAKTIESRDDNAWLYSMIPALDEAKKIPAEIPSQFVLAYVNCWTASNYIFNMGSSVFVGDRVDEVGLEEARHQYATAIASCRSEIARPLTLADISD